MKNYILLLLMMMASGMMMGQLKVVQSGHVVIGGVDAPEPLTLTTTGTPANFMIRRTDGGNFIKAVGGANGAAYFFKKENFMAFTPGDDQTDQSTDWGNALVLYGPNASGSKKGNVGIGIQNPTEKLHVMGNIKASGTVTSSDKKLKKNVKSISYGLEEVLKLNPLSYEYNGLGGTIDGEKHFGLFAQELRKVVPELVEEFQHIEYNENTIEDEEVIVSEETYLQVKDNEIKFLLINAIREQQAIIDAQIERINDIESILKNVQDNASLSLIESTLSLSDDAFLGLASPNPFINYTLIDYSIPVNVNKAIINIFGMDGRVIKVINVENRGEGQLRLNVDNMPAGTYTYQLVVDNKIVGTNKMIIAN